MLRFGKGNADDYKFRSHFNLNIAFIVSSAEPGKDGMGDYTLSLAGALRLLGHSVMVVALNDRWLPQPANVSRTENAAGVIVARLPSWISWEKRIQQACTSLKAFHPEWVSFQLSCYGYHPKGILFGFNRHLRKLSEVCENWQVMFQELWIGFEKGASWRHRLVGPVQRQSIKQFVRILRPKLLQTSTPLFQSLLRTLGLQATVLPLAGSIPISSEPGTGWFLQVLGGAGPPVAAQERRNYLVGGFLGTIYVKWEPEPFFSSLRAVARNTGQRVCILSAGRLGGREDVWGPLAAGYPDFHFIKLGEMSAERISQYFQNLDFGIAATPWSLIGKSSATAAMLDHGLQVMVTRNDVQSRFSLDIESTPQPLLVLAEREISDRFLSGLPRGAPRNSAADLAVEFVRWLALAKDEPRSRVG